MEDLKLPTTLAEFMEMAAQHTRVTVTSYGWDPPAISHREVTEVSPRGISTRFSNGHPFFIDWPIRRRPHGYEIQGTSLIWTNDGRRIFTYTFPLTPEQALAAAYDEAGQPHDPPN